MSTDKIQSQLDRVFGHIEVYNREMGCVQTDIKSLKQDVRDIKSSINGFEVKLDEALNSATNKLPTWAVVAISTLMGLLGIAFGLIEH